MVNTLLLYLKTHHVNKKLPDLFYQVSKSLNQPKLHKSLNALFSEAQLSTLLLLN